MGTHVGSAVAPLPVAATVPHSTVVSHPTSVRPAATVGPVNGRLISTSTGPNFGDALGGLVAVDNLTGTVYSANQGGTVTAFDQATGALLRASTPLPSQTVLGSESFGGIAYDPTSNVVFVGIDDSFNAGFVLALDATTLHQVANISGFSTPDFQPEFMVYDPTSDELFVQNSSYAITGIVNASSHAIIATLTPTCTATCVSYGLVDMAPENPWVVVEDGDSANNVIGLYSHSLLGGYYGATSAFGFGYATYDSVYNNYWVLNSSTYVYPEFEVFNASTGVFLASIYGVSFPGMPIFDPVNDAILVPEENSSILGGHQVAWYFGGFGIQVSVYSDPSLGYYTPYSSIVLASNSSTGVFIGTASFSSTGDQELVLGAGTISLAQNYSIIPVLLTNQVDSTQGLIVSVAETGDFYAFSTTTGAVVWHRDPYGSFPSLGVDSGLGTLYAPNGTSIDVLQAATGVQESSIAMPSAAFAELASVDAEHNQLYIYGFDVSGAHIYVFNLSGTTGTLAGSGLVSGTSLCFFDSLLAVPAIQGAALTSCGFGPTANNVTIFSGTNFTVVGSVVTGPSAYGLASDSAGNVYVGSLANRTVTVVNAETLANHTYTLPVGYYPLGLAYDPTLQALVATSVNTSTIDLLNPATGSVLATVDAPAVSFEPTVDNTTGSFYAPSVFAGVVFLASLVPLPSAVGGLSLTAGNTTLHATWSAATGSAGYPIGNYTVQWSANASGPWTSLPSTTGLQANLTGLTDGTTYYVTVYATSGAGVGPKSAAASGTPIGVPYPPTAVTATVTGSSSVNVSWGAPTSTQGSAVTGYTLQWATSLSGSWQSATVGLATHREVANLSASTTYYFRVMATNGAGTGNPSSPVSATTQSSSTGLGALFSGTTGLLLIGVIVAVIAAVIVAALLMSRRKKGSAPPQSWTAPPAAPAAPPTPPPASSPTPPSPPAGGPPPGAM